MRIWALLLLFATVSPGPPSAPMPPHRSEEIQSPSPLLAFGDAIPDLLLELVNEQIRGKLIPAGFSYEAPSTVLLDDVVLEGPQGEEIARAKRIAVDVQLRPLFSGNVILDRVSVSKVDLSLRHEGGKLNLIEAFSSKKKSAASKEKKESGQREIRIDAISLAEGNLKFSHENGFNLTINGIQLNASLEVDVKNSWVSIDASSVRAKSGLLNFPDFDLPLRDMRVSTVQFRGHRLDFSNVRGVCINSLVTGYGNIKFKDGGAYQISAAVDAPQDAWPSRLKRLPFQTPAIKANVKLRGPLSKPITSVEGVTGPFNAYDYAISKAITQLKIDQEGVHLQKTRLNVASGTLQTTGLYRFKEKSIELISHLTKVRLRNVVAPLNLDTPMQGYLSGAVSTAGPVYPKLSLSIDADLQGRNVSAYGVSPTGSVNIKSSVHLRDQAITFQSLSLSSPEIDLVGKGTVRYGEKSLNLDIESTLRHPERFYDQFPENLTVDTLNLYSRLNGSFDALQGEGIVAATDLSGWGLDATQLECELLFNKEFIVAEAIRANLQDGLAQGHVRIARYETPSSIDGQLQLSNLFFENYKLEEDDVIPISGTLSGDLRLGGTLDDVALFSDFSATNLVYDQFPIGQVTSEARFKNGLLSFQRMRVTHPDLMATSPIVQIRFTDKSITGRVMVRQLNLDHPAFADDARLDGSFNGPLIISGTFDNMKIRTRGQLGSLSIDSVPLGSGTLRGSLFSRTDFGERETLLQFSTTLFHGEGRIDGRAGYYVEDQVINSELTFRALDLQSKFIQWATEYPSLDGLVHGRMSLRGNIKNPSIELEADVPLLTLVPRVGEDALPVQNASLSQSEHSQSDQFVIAELNTTFLDHSKELSRHRTLGEARFRGTYKDGELDALLCGLPTNGFRNEYSPCAPDEKIWIQITGPIALDQSTMNLDIDGYLNESSLQDYLPAVKQQGIRLAGVLNGQVNLRKTEGQPIDEYGLVQLDSLEIISPDSPTINLKKPGMIELNRGIISPEEGLLFEIQEKEVRLLGLVDFERRQMNMSIDGELAFSMIQIFTPEITQANGTAKTLLSLTGSFDAPSLDGCLSPKPGAAITFRSLAREIDFKSGSFCFNTDPQSFGKQKLIAQELVCGLDDGTIKFDGYFFFLFDEDANQSVRFSDWNIRSSATDLRFRSDRTYIESAFDITLEEQNDQPLLSGRVEITDGKAQESFAFKNFILTSEASEESFRLVDLLETINLEDLEFDLDLDVQNTDLRVDLAQFRIDGNLQGNLHLGSTARLPDLSGAIDVTEGQVQFPYATFEVEQSQIEFPKRADGRIVPRIYVSAQSELDANRNGLGIEIPATLEFEGDTNQLALSLRADDAPQKISETDLLKFVLFGKPLQSDQFLAADPDAALRALSSELTLAFTRDLEDAMEEQFGTNIQFNLFAESSRVGGGIRYQLGDRVEFEGETGFISFGETATDATDDEEQVSVAEARVRLLVVDHLPSYLGEELAIEGEVTSGGSSTSSSASANGDLRFTYRFFSF